mmetsp:Transcript_92486/g.261835  ORF Transcript_92486/g.261835 Transcript_92486/m.261835 type:complete len:206 (-) Transcript_92486:145-762(-)
MQVGRVVNLGGTLSNHHRQCAWVVSWKWASLEGGEQEEEVEGGVDDEGQPCCAEGLPEAEQPHLRIHVAILFSGLCLQISPFVLPAHVGDAFTDPRVEIHAVLYIELERLRLAKKPGLAADQLRPNVGEGEEVVARTGQVPLAGCRPRCAADDGEADLDECVPLGDATDLVQARLSGLLKRVGLPLDRDTSELRVECNEFGAMEP